MVSRGKVVIIASFIGLGGMMLFFYLYANSFQPQLQQVEISLKSIKVLDVDKINNRAHLQIEYFLDNPTKVTSTISTIDYKLYADGQFLGEGHFSVEDIPMEGRPALFPGGNTTITDKFELVKKSDTTDAYDKIIGGEPVKYEDKGQITVESTLTLVNKDFDLHLG